MEALLFTIDGHRYGVWKNQISSVEKVGAVHRLPFLRSSLTVLAVVGDHTKTLADLSLCLGHPPEKGASSSNALVMSEHGQVRGFLVSQGLVSREVEPEAVIALPDHLFIPFIENFLSQDGAPVPMVAVCALFDQVMSEGISPNVRLPAIKNLLVSEGSSAGFRVAEAGKSLLAFAAGELSDQSGGCRISRFPLLPSDVDGITILGNKLLPIIDLGRRVCQRKLSANPLLLEARLGSAIFGLLVDDDRGEWTAPEAVVKDLPFLCQTPWSRCAAIHKGEAAPIIDLAALLSVPEGAAEKSVATERYVPESDFPAVFGEADAEVIEIPILGRRLAIPRTEVSATIRCTSVYPLPLAPGILAGVGMLEGELLPVLDLARLLGESSKATAAWRMIPVSNGNFKALVLSEKEPEPRSIKVGIQRDVPVHLPYPVVYGCYTDGDAIRLILNIYALALHFDESRAAELLLPLSPVETTRDGEIDTRKEAEVETTGKTEVAPHPEEVPTPQETQASAPQMDLIPPPEKTIAQKSPQSEPAATVSEVAASNLLPNEETSIFIDEDLIEVPAAEPPTTTATSSLPPSSHPFPPAAGAPESLTAKEEELFVEEVHLRKQLIDEEPVHRRRRMLVGFVASALFLLVVVYGLYLIGLVHEPSSPQHVQGNVTAPQATATTPALASPPSTPSQTSNNAPYVVKEGDTLWDIAQRLTGDPFNYHNLAGRNLIKNPDLIFPGQTIQIDSQQKQ